MEVWKSGKINRKSWLDKERDVDIFDIKGDVVKTLVELGIEEKKKIFLLVIILNIAIILEDQDLLRLNQKKDLI